MIKSTQCLQLEQLVQLCFLLLAGKLLPFCSEPICDALDVQCSMYSFEINVGYYSIFKAKTEKGCIKHLGGIRREGGEENKMKRQ